MSRVKFTVFSDLHHHPAWYKTEAPERLAAIQKRALESGSEFLLHMGDFSHKPSACPELIRQYKEFRLPGYFVLGNHEFDIDSYETVLETMGMENGYYYFDHGGFRFVIMDENYFRDFPGVYFHYSERNYFDHPAARDWMPPEEIDWVRKTVMDSPYPCILASHAPVEYAPNPKAGIRCKDELIRIIRDSQGTPGQVILCLNGHYHRSGMDVIDGVPRLDVNSASFNRKKNGISSMNVSAIWSSTKSRSVLKSSSTPMNRPSKLSEWKAALSTVFPPKTAETVPEAASALPIWFQQR